MARYFGIGTRDITLYPLGGVARLDSTGEKPVQELAIALAGPAVNLMFAIVLAPVAITALLTGWGAGDLLNLTGQGALGVVARFTVVLWFSNIVLLLFNLLPAFPMDGGRVLRAILSEGMSRVQATQIAVGVGVFMAILFGAGAALGLSPWLLLIALLVCLMGQQELQALRYQEAQRRAQAQAAGFGGPPPVVVVPPRNQPATEGGGFTGLVWDRDLRVWVRWLNGRPVQIHS
jgi:Zn-dependent protease